MSSRVQILLLLGLAVVLTGCVPPSNETISLIVPDGYKPARIATPEDNLSWEQKASMAIAVADADAQKEALAATSDFAPKNPAFVALQAGIQASKATVETGRIVSSKRHRGYRHRHHRHHGHRRHKRR